MYFRYCKIVFLHFAEDDINNKFESVVVDLLPILEKVKLSHEKKLISSKYNKYASMEDTFISKSSISNNKNQNSFTNLCFFQNCRVEIFPMKQYLENINETVLIFYQDFHRKQL